MVKKIIIIVLVLGVLFAGFAVISNHLSYKNVEVKFSDTTRDVEVTISSEDGTTKTVKSSQNVRVKKGDYAVVVSGKNYETQNFDFEVTDEGNTITIDPSYSKERLKTLLANQEQQIQSLIKSSYKIGSDYKINDGELYRHGEWYGTTISPNLTEEQLRTSYTDLYRVVLTKENNQWKVVSQKPEPVVTIYNSSNTPIEVLDNINRQRSGIDSQNF